MPASKLLTAFVMFLISNWSVQLSAKPQSNEQVTEKAQNVTVIPAITKAWQTAELFSRGTGIVAKVNAEVGDEVSEGDALVIMDDPTLHAELSILQAELKEVKAELKLHQLDLKRADRLLEDNLVSISDGDRLRAEVDKSDAVIEAIKAKIYRKKIQLDFLIIRAPFDGFVTNRNIEQGDLVMSDNKAGRALLEVAHLSKLRVQYRIPQGLFHKLSKCYSVYFSSKNYVQTLHATVDLISPNIDGTFGTVLMESWVDNENLKLPSGLRGEVEIKLTESSYVSKC
ncbi:efflux RND transporter periplasmic adaptor subunit [Paraglaciecola chathamensis]|jgi:RND family efflux transporter MFP subunit|uniref:CzcB-like barrel-sandwich hybrid domain-containing protein n=1 Tax=Paraglaciecola chathamensis TaxID=368405 RepID=A0A8H9IHN7_9ALTE|nr:efflux RND transporter periplasmic adaptor subunit [Paraglaciecola oceanifecundans]GGZ79985.1 hypothetical protein GCM10011274_42390 [Paraglaciecola oceanifecundans]|tara:strand:- start:9786 stop:10637 length:852 start_codon:yes stop_codon:yes gene_type:complete